MTKNCLNCEKPITGKSTKQYCSDGCKQEAYRQRNGVDKPEFLKPDKKHTKVTTPKAVQPIEAKPILVTEQVERDNRFVMVSEAIVELNSKIYRLQFQKENLLKKIAALENTRSAMGDVSDGITAGADWGHSLRDTFNSNGAGKLGVALGLLAGLQRMHNTDHDEINRRNRHKARTLRGELHEVDSEINELTTKRIYLDSGLSQLKREIKQELVSLTPITTAPTIQRELPGVVDVATVTRRDNARVISLTELKAQEFDMYDFTGGFEEIIGNPAKNFSMVVYGESGQGKSTWVIEFANYLAEHHGRVLYNSSEERISQSLKRKLLKYDSDNFAIAECQTYKALKTAVRGNGFKFIVIDSVNDMNIKPNQLAELTEMNPDKAFIFILQATKQGTYKGNSQFVHDADVLIRLENYQPIVEKTRYR